MLELELQQYLLHKYSQENARCEWKEFKNLKNSFCGDEKDDVISYVSAIANMEGGHLVLGVKDKTLEIVGTDISRLTFNGQPANTQSATFKLTEQCTYLSSEGLSIEEFVTDDTNKRVWIIHIPKHLPRRPVLAHKKAWQRIEDSLVEMTSERMSVILEEPIYTAKDWSAEIVPDATIDDLDEVDYEHFTVPFILTVDEILSKIENLTLREMPGGTLFPDTMKQYDDYTIREALHNCIAHQDYTLQQRINFVENPGYLYYSNAGTFIPGTLENVLKNEEPQTHFRNECLCRAMVDFNMIDTVSRGIKKMFNEQWRRHFPMPDYEIDQIKKKVVVRIYGNEINKRYTDLLKTNDTLSLWDCISLDAVQKGRTIHEDIAQDLLKRGLIEGDAPHYSISLSIAKNTHQLPSYTKTKGLDKEKLRQMILQFLQNAGDEGAKRDSIYEYLKDVLPANKTEEQKLRYVGRLLVELNEEKQIDRIGLRWILNDYNRSV